MSNIPAHFNYINAMAGRRNPSEIHASDNALSWYFEKYLLQEVISVYKWELPNQWAKNYFLYTLFTFGYVAVVDTDKFGIIPQACGLNGYDVFYQPTNATISNPLLTGILTPRIGVQCELIKLQPDYGSVMDIVTRYADMLAMTLQTAAGNIQASKLAYVFAASGKNSAESFKKMFDGIMVGKPAVVVDRELSAVDGNSAWTMFNNNLRNNYIAGDMLCDLQKLRDMFKTEIGIPSANTDKKERLIVDEVNSNNIATYSKAALWLEELRGCCEKCIAMFPQLDGHLSVNWRFENAEEVVTNDVDNLGTL